MKAAAPVYLEVFGGTWWCIWLNQHMWVNGSCWEREKLTRKFVLDWDPARIVKETYLHWISSFSISITIFLYRDMTEIVMDIFLLCILSLCFLKKKFFSIWQKLKLFLYNLGPMPPEPPGTMKNEHGTMKDHESRPGTMKNHENQFGTVKTH